MVEPGFGHRALWSKVYHLTIPTGDPNPKMLISSSSVEAQIPGGTFAAVFHKRQQHFTKDSGHDNRELKPGGLMASGKVHK